FILLLTLFLFCFSSTAPLPTELSALSLHDALPILSRWLMDKPPAPFHKQMGDFPDGINVDRWQIAHFGPPCFVKLDVGSARARRDRKSTRLNSSHRTISYAVFCLKKKKNIKTLHKR